MKLHNGFLKFSLLFLAFFCLQTYTFAQTQSILLAQNAYLDMSAATTNGDTADGLNDFQALVCNCPTATSLSPRNGAKRGYSSNSYALSTLVDAQSTSITGTGDFIPSVGDVLYILTGNNKYYKMLATATNDGTGISFDYEYLGAGLPPAPTASFTNTNVADMYYTFSDTSTGTPTSWSWDWGDGTTNSTAQNPFHYFLNPGTYTVTLTATNAGGSDPSSTAITVTTSGTLFAPNAFIDFDSDGQNDLQAKTGIGCGSIHVGFLAQANMSHTSISKNYNLVDLADATAASYGTSNFCHPTQYNDVLLIKTTNNKFYKAWIVSNNDSGDAPEGVRLIYAELGVVIDPPVAAFTHSNITDLYHSFTDTSTDGPTGWTWDFGDGTPTSGGQNPIHYFLNPGTFTVQLTVTNAGGSDSTSQSVTVSTSATFYAPNAYIDLDSDTNNDFQVQNAMGCGATYPNGFKTQAGARWDTISKSYDLVNLADAQAGSYGTSDFCVTPSYTTTILFITTSNKYYKAWMPSDNDSTPGPEGLRLIYQYLGDIDPPTLTTTAISSITQTTASSGGNISLNGGSEVLSRGVCWSTSTSPTTADSTTSDGTGIGSFTSSLTTLTMGTTYYVRAYATNIAGTGYGNQQTFTTVGPPSVTTLSTSAIATTTATGNGDITNLGNPNPTAYGVCWGTSLNPTTAGDSTDEGTASATGTFNSPITGLTPGTTYWVRAYATNSQGTSYGGNASFTALLLPTVTTQAVSAILGTTATGNGTITSLGVPDPTAHGVVYNTTGTPTLADSTTDQGAAAATTAFTTGMTGLNYGTMYYVRAYATNGAGTSYGSEVSFTTAILPSTTTDPATAIGDTTATLNGTVNANSFSTTVTFEYGLTTGYGTTVTADESPASGSTNTAVSKGITGLIANTTYHYRVVAINAVGSSNGADQTFITTGPPTVTTQAATAITTTTATGNGNIAALGNPNPTAYGVCWGLALNPTTAGDSTNEGGASATGAFTSSITGLTPGTLYHVRAYATNSSGTAYGADLTFTSYILPVVTTQAASAILGTTATGNGNITSLGVPNPTAHGVVFNTTGTPTLTDSSTDEGAAGATGAFTSSMIGLVGSTTYYVRAYATNAVGTSYGSEVNFTTLALPSLTTTTLSSIADTTASSGGNISADGGSAVTARGVCWSLTPNPTTADFSTNDGTGIGAFASSLTGLTAVTTYYVRAYATTGFGTGYGNELSFTTTGPPTATTNAATGLNNISATLNGSVTANDLSTTVSFQYGLTTAYGTTITADQSPVTGSSATAVSKLISGLTPNTTYHYRVVATNASATTNGPDMTFSTLIQHTVTFNLVGNGFLSGTTTQIISLGADCSPITVHPDANHLFDGWTGDVTSSVNPLNVTNVTADMTITANIIVNPDPPPSIDSFTGPTTVSVGQTAIFNIDITDNIDIASIALDYGDEMSAKAASISNEYSHVYTAEGVYTVKLTATDNNGSSSSEQLTIFVTPLDVDIPVGNLKATPLGNGQMMLTWTGGSDDQAELILFIIKRGTTTTKVALNDITSVTSWSYIDKNISTDQEYTYEVQAEYAGGVKGIASQVTASQDDLQQKVTFPHVAQNEQWWTGIVLVNTAKNDQELTFVPVDKNGDVIAGGVNLLELAAGEKTVGLATNYFSQSTLDQISWFYVLTSDLITGFELFGQEDQIMAGVEVDQRLDFNGHFLVGQANDNLFSAFSLINMDWTNANSIFFSGYSADGTVLATNSSQMAVGEKQALTVQDMFGETYDPAITSVSWSADGPVWGFGLWGDLGFSYESGSPTQQYGKLDSWIPMAESGSNFILQNSARTTNSIEVKAYSNDGTLVSTLNLELAMLEKKEWLTDSLFGNGFAGSIHIKSTGACNALVDIKRSNNDGDMSEAVAAQTASGYEFTFAHVASNNQWTTELMMSNARDKSEQLIMIGRDILGNAIETIEVQVAGHGRLHSRVKDLFSKADQIAYITAKATAKSFAGHLIYYTNDGWGHLMGGTSVRAQK